MAESNDKPWHLWMVTAYTKVSGNCLLYVNVEIFHDGKFTLDLLHVVQYVCVIKLNCDMVWSDRHHRANGTIYQASICVNVAA